MKSGTDHEQARERKNILRIFHNKMPSSDAHPVDTYTFSFVVHNSQVIQDLHTCLTQRKSGVNILLEYDEHRYHGWHVAFDFLYEYPTYIEGLSITGFSLNRTMAQNVIASCMKRMTNLRWLSLPNTKLTPGGVRVIMSALSACPLLTTIDLSNNLELTDKVPEIIKLKEQYDVLVDEEVELD